MFDLVNETKQLDQRRQQQSASCRDMGIGSHAEQSRSYRAACEVQAQPDKATRRRSKRRRYGYDGGKYENSVAPTSRQSRRLHTADGPKNRGNVPTRLEIIDYSHMSRSQRRRAKRTRKERENRLNPNPQSRGSL